MSFVCSISGVETDRAWRREGQKLSSATPRFVSHRTAPCSAQVLAAAAGACSIASAQEAGLQITEEEASRTKAMPSSIQNALRMIISQGPVNQLNRRATPNQPVMTDGGGKEPEGVFVNGSGGPEIGAVGGDGGPGNVNGVGGKGKAFSQLESLLCEESLARKPAAKHSARAIEKQEKADAKHVDRSGAKPAEKQKDTVPSAATNDRAKGSVDRKEAGGNTVPAERTRGTRKRPLSSDNGQAATKKVALDLPLLPPPRQTSPPKQHRVPLQSVSQPRQASPLVSTPPSQRAAIPTNPPTTSQSAPSASTALSTAPSTPTATPTLPATPIIPLVPPSTPMDMTPPTDTLISDLISDTSDTAVFSLASELGLANVNSLLNLSDFMSFIQPNAGEATPIGETTLSITQFSGVDSAVSTPFPVTTPFPAFTATTPPNIPQPSPVQTNTPHPLPLMEIAGMSNPLGMTKPSNVSGPSKPCPPPLTVVTNPSPPMGGNRPDSLLLQSTPASFMLAAATTVATPTPNILAPSVMEGSGVMSSADYLDFTDIGSLVGSADDLLEGIPEDMAKSIQTLAQLDQQAWN